MKLIKQIIRQQLTESKKGSDVLVLNFIPAMDPEGSEYQLYIDVLKYIYPNLRWNGGGSSHLSDFTPYYPVVQLLVGYDRPNCLMWNPTIYHPNGIDAREWLGKFQGFNTEDAFGSIYESDDSLEWAEDLINSVPNLPIVDGQRRVIRSKGGLSRDYLEVIMSLLSKNGYSFRSGSIIHLLTILGNGGYLHLHPNGRLTHGSGEWSFIDANDGLRFSDVPNIFI